MTRAKFDMACLRASFRSLPTSIPINGGALLVTTSLSGKVRLFLNETGAPRRRISRAAAEALIEEAR